MKVMHAAGLALGMLMLAAPAYANAVVPFSQDFETDTAGWFDGGGFGTITRVASGTGGITSFQGSNHAVVTEDSPCCGPFTRFGGYADTFPEGGYTTSLAIYLDTSWAAGSGFDYSVASSRSNGDHLRDFIFHVTQDTSEGQLFVGASNNSSDASPDENLENGAHFVVADSGWYIFQQVFRDDGGVLAVDMNLLDAGGAQLFTTTLETATDTIPAVVGGNRYGWFTTIDVAGGVAIDATRLKVPEPGTLALFGFGLAGLGAVRRRRRR